ncbi:hypothetical protein ACUR5C_08065 [Aliikangiella sp. IMCC44653]
MKKLSMVISALAASSIALSANAGSYEFAAADNSHGTQLCIAAVTNDLAKYRSLVNEFEKGTRLESRAHRVVANKQKCNDINIVRFSRMYQAGETSRFMSQFLERSVSVKRDLAEQAPLDKNALVKPVILVSGR